DDVRLPVMVCYDGFIVSHSLSPVDLIEDREAQDFVRPFKAVRPLLDPSNPVTYGPLALFDYYFEFKRQQAEVMKAVPGVFEEVAQEYARVSGRYYGAYEKYQLDDAEVGIVALGSAASTAEIAVDRLRQEGLRAGLLKLKMFRPLPKEDLVRELSGLKALCVLDRADSPGAGGGPVGIEIRSALLDSDRRPKVINGIYGLGGRDTTPEMIQSVYHRLERIARTGEVDESFFYLGVRGGNGNGTQSKADVHEAGLAGQRS
ncbi:MAG: pyruvate ferredoxin oxidoreductase, partial [Chloroflexi bacterium]|nr:pyruvate ferredoxin oxidoreductase [Chloroflexota bacterium]